MQLTKNAGATKDSLKQNDKFIESLSLQTGILDDDLRPSMAKFGNVTKNVKQAQKLLTLSLDVTAGSGKSQTKVANALAKAYAGNTKSLIGMFPELKNSKNALADLTKEFSGAALVNADPFMKFNNSMDILKEKLGNLVLPMIADLVTELTKPGGVVETVGKFLTDLANPKTEPGKMFKDIKDAVKDAFQGVKDFFALFGNGDAMKGFGVVVSNLVKALPALLALKGIMMLASATTTITNLAKAMGLISAQSAAGGLATGGATVAGGVLSVGLMAVSAVALTQIGASIAVAMADASVKGALDRKGLKTTTASAVFGARGEVIAIPSTGDVHDLFGINKEIYANQQKGSIFNITVTNADPKATVDAIAKYVKTNGALPSYFVTGKVRR
jgi:hypothetical protein